MREIDLTKAVVVVDGGFKEELVRELPGLIDRPVYEWGSQEIEPGQPVVVVSEVRPDHFDSRDVVWFHSAWVGADAVLRGEPWPEDLLLTRTIGKLDRRVATYVLAWALEDAQRVTQFTQWSSARKWEQQPTRMLDDELFVVFGTGQMGTAVATMLRAVGARVAGVSTTLPAKPDDLRSASYVVSTLPLTEHTRNYFDSAFFSSLGKAMFINVGRGASVDYSALREALDKGNVRRAVLDVMPHEPVPSDSDWWAMPNVVITPHVAGLTDIDDVLTEFVDSWRTIAKGQIPATKVDVTRGY